MIKAWIETYEVDVTGGLLTIGGQDNFTEWIYKHSAQIHASPVKVGVFDKRGRQYVWIVWEKW